MLLGKSKEKVLAELKGCSKKRKDAGRIMERMPTWMEKIHHASRLRLARTGQSRKSKEVVLIREKREKRFPPTGGTHK